MNKGTGKREKAQESLELETRCWVFLRPFLEELHKWVDRRLVKTLLDLVLVILMHRNRNSGLLLSELGDHLLGGEHGPAGVKRIASLVHSVKWGSQLILRYLWKQAHQKVQELLAKRETAYVIWDESVLEKPESLQAEGLCAVRSTKAARLKRIKPGYFNPTHGSTDICARLQLAAGVSHRFERCPRTGTLVLVDNEGRKSQPKTGGRRQNPEKSGKTLGEAGDTHLGPWLCRQPMDHTGTRPSSALYPALEQELPLGRTGWPQTRSLEDCTGQTFLGIPHDLGCPQTLSAQDRCHRPASSFTPGGTSALSGGLPPWLWSQTLVSHHHRTC